MPSPERSSAARSLIGLALALTAAAALAGCGSGDGGRPGFAAPVQPAPSSPGEFTASDAPFPETPSPTATPSQGPTPTRSPKAVPPPKRPPANVRYVFPVAGRPVSYHPTHSVYPATDIFANCGSPVRAVTDGTVLEVSRVDKFVKSNPDGALKGGLFVSLLGIDGVRYYGSHLSKVGAGIEAGVRVRAGQQIGAVGRTGNANNVCHLHFGISPPCARTDDWWNRRGVVWPASYLDAWRAGNSRSPAQTVTAWQRRNGCPRTPPAS